MGKLVEYFVRCDCPQFTEAPGDIVGINGHINVQKIPGLILKPAGEWLRPSQSADWKGTRSK
jgi:hypothetical protein